MLPTGHRDLPPCPHKTQLYSPTLETLVTACTGSSISNRKIGKLQKNIYLLKNKNIPYGKFIHFY